MEKQRELAQPGQYLTIRLKDQFYGVAIGTVREINQMGDIVPVPKTPEFVVGVMNLRGKVIPVVDLRLKFGLEKSSTTRETCIVVIDAEVGQVGVVVDAVNEVVELAAGQIEPPPLMGGDNELAFVKGMGKIDNKVIILIDIVNSLSKDQFSHVVDQKGQGQLAA